MIALRHSYHGRSFATINASGQRGWRSTTLSPLQVHYAQSPYCYRCPWGLEYPSCGLKCADDIADIIATNTSGHPAAFIAEPIQGVGGFITPPPEYFVRVQEILDRYGVPFIADEVQTGWGRMGVADFGFQAYGVEPDVVVFAKGLANGVPIGGLIATDELASSIRSLSLSTFGGNPIATTAALANLNYIATNNLRQNALETGAYLKERLWELQDRHAAIGDVRGMGLMVGIELVRDRATKEPAPDILLRVQEGAKTRGLIVGRGGLHANTIRLCPPLIVTRDDVDAADRDPRRGLRGGVRSLTIRNIYTAIPQSCMVRCMECTYGFGRGRTLRHGAHDAGWSVGTGEGRTGPRDGIARPRSVLEASPWEAQAA